MGNSNKLRIGELVALDSTHFHRSIQTNLVGFRSKNCNGYNQNREIGKDYFEITFINRFIEEKILAAWSKMDRLFSDFSSTSPNIICNNLDTTEAISNIIFPPRPSESLIQIEGKIVLNWVNNMLHSTVSFELEDIRTPS